MKVSTLLILGAAGAGAFFLLKRPAQAGTPPNKGTGMSYAIAFRAGGFASPEASPAGKSSAPAVGGPSVSAKDVISGLAAAGAGAGCAAIPGVGAAVAPLCGAAGAQVGAKAYEYGVKAYDEVASWF